MKKFLRVLSLVLSLCLAVSGFGTTAFAAEEVQAEEPTVVEFEITSDSADEGAIAVPLVSNVIDQTFTMTSTHRGADRTYSEPNLRYAVTITDANGNAVGDLVAVELHDYNHATAIKADSVGADGSTYVFDVPIVTNRVYYFVYNKVSGTTGTLRVHMYIYSHS